MRKYFGTDGIRRIANTELSPELVYRVAKAGACVFSKHTNNAPTILIGRDTRISGGLIESAMTAGFLSFGANVKLLGIMPTPAVAYLTRKYNADASVVISASHNTYEFNGIKYFSNKGMKIPDSLEEEIEEIIDSNDLSCLSAKNEKIGISQIETEYLDDYVEFFKDNFKDDFDKFEKNNFKVAIDTANGATYEVAKKVFDMLNINYQVINDNPNGININENCGSTHLESLKEFVTKNKFDIGIAYDGDGDRCLLVDENGNEINGDIILAIFAKYLKEKNMLKNNTIVATVMSNLGLKKFAIENDINFEETKVGDRYVLEKMLDKGYNLGGEQSGHVILLNYNPTGDGILTSVMMLKILLEKKISLSEATKIINIYPQVLVNVKVSEEKKNSFKDNIKFNEKIEEIEKELSDEGRVLVRASGTEPLIRIMIEGKDIKDIENKANALAQLI